MNKNEERKAWVAFMAALVQHYVAPMAAEKADRALDEYRKRYPALLSNWQQDQQG